MTPRIHFGVCGIGYGHASRSAILAREFMRRGWRVSISSYKDGLRYLKASGIEAKYSPEISYGILPEGKVSIKMTIFRNILLPIRFLEQLSYELNYIEDADIVISDSRVSTILAGKISGKPVLTILNQFNIRVEYPRHKRIIELVEALAQAPSHIWMLSDEILIADYPPPYTISKHNLVIPERVSDKTRYIGPIMERSRKYASSKHIYEKYGLVEGSNPIIFYHASGPSYERRILTSMILPILEKLSKDYQIIATLGGDDPPKNIKGVHAFSWVEDPGELFSIADLVICRAGQTTLAKALAYGKPVITIPIPAHGEQLGNASSIMQVGAGILLHQENLSLETLRSAIEKIFSDKSFFEKAGEYRRFVEKLNSVEYVCSKILELVG